jgi:hypothetical protein
MSPLTQKLFNDLLSGREKLSPGTIKAISRASMREIASEIDPADPELADVLDRLRSCEENADRLTREIGLKEDLHSQKIRLEARIAAIGKFKIYAKKVHAEARVIGLQTIEIYGAAAHQLQLATWLVCSLGVARGTATPQEAAELRAINDAVPKFPSPNSKFSLSEIVATTKAYDKVKTHAWAIVRRVTDRAEKAKHQ